MPGQRNLKKSNSSANSLQGGMMFSRFGLKAEKVDEVDISLPAGMNGGPGSASNRKSNAQNANTENLSPLRIP